MDKRPSYEYLSGISYHQRLQLLQDHYLGAYKARQRAERGPARGKGRPNFAPGSEAERVYFYGRY